MSNVVMIVVFFFFKQKTAYEMRISDWSSDVCSSDLDDRRPAGHIFAASRAAACDHHLRARMADGEAFARLTGGEKLARRCPVQNGVADNGVLLAFQRAAHHGLNRDDPARQTLADIIIGVAEDFEPDALAQKRAQRLARTTAQADMDMPVSQRGHAEIGRAHV